MTQSYYAKQGNGSIIEIRTFRTTAEHRNGVRPSPYFRFGSVAENKTASIAKGG